MVTLETLLGAAKILIDYRGDGAEAEAVRQAENWRAQGNEDGFELWSAIATAVKVVRDHTRLPHEALH